MEGQNSEWWHRAIARLQMGLRVQRFLMGARPLGQTLHCVGLEQHWQTPKAGTHDLRRKAASCVKCMVHKGGEAAVQRGCATANALRAPMAAAMPPAPRHPQLEGASVPGADAPHSLCTSPADQQSHEQQQGAKQRSRTGRGTHAGEADGLTALHNRYWRSKHAKNGCRCCRPSRVGACMGVRWRNAVVGIADRAANGTWRFTQHPGTHCPRPAPRPTQLNLA